MIRIAIIGFGYWGQKLFSKISELESFQIECICDRNGSGNLDKVPARYATETQIQNIDFKKIDLVIVATPLEGRDEILDFLTTKNVHIFSTKPVSLSIRQLENLKVNLITNKKYFFVDHTFLFMPEFDFLKSRIKSKSPVRISSQREQSGKLHKMSNALFELTYHDIYIFLELAKLNPTLKIKAEMFDSKGDGYFDSSTLNIEDSLGNSAFMKASLSSVNKNRQIKIEIENHQYVWNFSNAVSILQADGKIIELDKHILVQNNIKKDALIDQFKYIESVLVRSEKYRDDLETALTVTKILLLALESYKNKTWITL